MWEHKHKNKSFRFSDVKENYAYLTMSLKSLFDFIKTSSSRKEYKRKMLDTIPYTIFVINISRKRNYPSRIKNRTIKEESEYLDKIDKKGFSFPHFDCSAMAYKTEYSPYKNNLVGCNIKVGHISHFVCWFFSQPLVS